jgi:hypothetical protein
MPRNRRDDNIDIKLKPQDIEEDYLDVDKPLPGQNFYCISFVSPEKILEQKELFMYYHYEQAFYKKVNNMMDTTLTEIIDNSPDGKVDIADIVKLKKNVIQAAKEEQVSFEQFKTKFEDFRFRDEEKIGEVFDKQNNFKTSVRGVKVRGVFDTKREADVRASVLQRLDPLFDVFVGQVGYWCPWDPNPQKIDDVEYLNNDLNKLVKEYKANEAKKDAFYNEQKTQRQKDALSAEERLKHQQGLAEMRNFQEAQKNLKQEQQLQESATLDSIIGNMSNTPTGLINTGTMINNNLEDLMNITENNISTSTTNSITQSIQMGNSANKESTLEAETAQMESDDPWLKRKMEQSLTDTTTPTQETVPVNNENSPNPGSLLHMENYNQHFHP